MKKRNYEKTSLFFFLLFLLFLGEFIVFIMLFSFKVPKYLLLKGISNKSYIVMYVTKYERKMLYANSFFYYKGVKKQYSIIEDHGVVFHQNRISHYEIILDVEVDKDKLNDVFTFSIKIKNIRLFDFFRQIMEGD